MQVELKAIQRELGITFVIVTHDQDEALTLSGSSRRLQQRPCRTGRGRPGGLRESVNRFVADFVGTSNVLGGGPPRTCSAEAETQSVRSGWCC